MWRGLHNAFNNCCEGGYQGWTKEPQVRTNRKIILLRISLTFFSPNLLLHRHFFCALPFPIIVETLELNCQHSRELLYAHSLDSVNLKEKKGAKRPKSHDCLVKGQFKGAVSRHLSETPVWLKMQKFSQIFSWLAFPGKIRWCFLFSLCGMLWLLNKVSFFNQLRPKNSKTTPTVSILRVRFKQKRVGFYSLDPVQPFYDLHLIRVPTCSMVWGSFGNAKLYLVTGQENPRHIFVESEAKTIEICPRAFARTQTPAACIFFFDWLIWLSVSADWFAFKGTQLNTALGSAI